MKIEELNQEQIEKAKSLATDEERLAYLKECRVELEDDMLSEISGGFDHIHLPDCSHEWKKTGKRRRGSFLGWVDDVEYKCEKCGKKEWHNW